MLDRFRIFMGPERFRTLILLLVTTGLISTVMVFIDQPWSETAQTVMLLIFLGGAAFLVVGRMEGDDRYRWGATLAPALGLVILGIFFLPHLLPFILGAAVGWIIVGGLIFGRSRAPIQYRQAVKAMRKNDYAAAVKAMDGLIKQEAQEANHYRFRAELYRLWGKLPAARRDYERMLEAARNDPTRAVAYNGLAEVDLQAGKFAQARESARRAFELVPGEWVAAYNLGMIEDRLGDSAAVIASLEEALKVKVPDARHRLLIQLYLLRAHQAQKNAQAAQHALQALRRERDGLHEWKTLLASDQAAALRAVLAADVEQAAALIEGRISLNDLSGARA